MNINSCNVTRNNTFGDKAGVYESIYCVMVDGCEVEIKEIKTVLQDGTTSYEYFNNATGEPITLPVGFKKIDCSPKVKVTNLCDLQPKAETVTGEDCEGADVEVTGTAVREVVQAKGTVFTVKMCPDDKDFELSCGIDPITGHQIQTAYKIVAGNFEVINRWDTVTGQSWGGDPTTLESCGGTKLESDEVVMCDSGVTFLRWFIKKEGEPTGVTYDTDINGSPYTVTDEQAVTTGKCIASCARAPLGVVNSWAI